MTDLKPTMRAITATWNEKPTFKLMPFTQDCLFVEGLYDPETNTLVLFSKEKKDTLHMIPRLNDDGEVIQTTKRKAKAYKEQRITLASFMEYYITEKKEICEVVDSLIVNPEFEYKKFITEKPKEEKKKSSKL